MSYEGKMLQDLKMPPKKEVERALLISLFNNNGVIKEFGSNEQIVDELADYFNLNNEQRTAYLETIYRKENRIKRSLLWHRLLFRAADSLGNENYVSRPSQTFKLTNKKEWMLTESGYDKVLKIQNISGTKKDILNIKSYEVDKIVKKINQSPRPENYIPFKNKKTSSRTIKTTLRERGFRQAIIQAYEYRCAVCGLKIYSPDSLYWEVEAAHIVPHRAMGKDDIWNGVALCHLHHWSFDVGWFTISKEYKIEISPLVKSLPSEYGKIGDYEFFKLTKNHSKIFLPSQTEIYPHHNSIDWHRQNIFHK